MILLRKVIFWCHLATGVVAGAIILLMSVTGVLLAYQRQIQNWGDARSYQVSAHSGAATRLPPEALLTKLREVEKATPTSLTVRSDPSAAAAFNFGGGRTVFVNPYTGEVLGPGALGVRSFFRVVTDWHRWLGAQGENRATARAITGACNLGFLFLVSSGFYLWWPRNWTRKAVRAVAWFRRGQSTRARHFNWHNVIGFWSVLPLFIVVLSGVVISYTWASNLVYRAAGEEPPPAQRPQQQPQTPPANAGEAPQGPALFEGLGRLLERAERQEPGWRTITLQLPTKPDAPVTFALDRGDGGQPQLRSTLVLDRSTGEVARWEPFTSLTTGRRLRSILRFAHTGEVLGLFGQTVAGLVSLGGAFLVYTGLSLALRRLFAWVARRRRAAGPAAEPTAAEG
ncbi:MAG TPA: PepSY-associated TM helix domain-containing protein [Pyrinomonadaceae bacterium]|nr:PepSY-associated TM helix domain-containing protein [Pyrinomonadaceae bacterium]